MVRKGGKATARARYGLARGRRVQALMAEWGIDKREAHEMMVREMGEAAAVKVVHFYDLEVAPIIRGAWKKACEEWKLRGEGEWTATDWKDAIVRGGIAPRTAANLFRQMRSEGQVVEDEGDKGKGGSNKGEGRIVYRLHYVQGSGSAEGE